VGRAWPTSPTTGPAARSTPRRRPRRTGRRGSHTDRFQLSLQDSDLAQGRNFTQAFTFEARNTSAYSQVILGDNPLSYWRLNESAGTVAADATGTTNAAYVNGPTLGTASGVTGGGTAARFVYGNWSSVDAGDVYDFTGQAPFPAECWLQRTTTDENSSHESCTRTSTSTGTTSTAGTSA
jgi:hypothetical protein